MGWRVQGLNPGSRKIFRNRPDRALDLPTTCHIQKSNNIDRKHEVTFKIENLFELSLLRSEYSETAQLAVHLLPPVATTAVTQDFRNSSSLRPSKDANSVPKQTCRSSYPISKLNLKISDIWKSRNPRD